MTQREVEQRIERDLRAVSDKPVEALSLIRAKDGVHVYRALYGGVPVVMKHFEREGDRREILNYRILQCRGVPTLRVLACGLSTLCMEDIGASESWRLGAAEDMADIDVAAGLAHWYFALHENGTDVPELDALYAEYDAITRKSLAMLMERLPEARATFQYMLERFDELRHMIDSPSYTLTYNNFYWVNLAVRNDRRAAMMFDFNLMGKGYRFADIRNVCSALSETAGAAFVDAYNDLYIQKHGHSREAEEDIERQVDELASPLFSLISAYAREDFPAWADNAKALVVDGTLLERTKRVLSFQPEHQG